MKLIDALTLKERLRELKVYPRDDEDIAYNKEIIDAIYAIDHTGTAYDVGEVCIRLDAISECSYTSKGCEDDCETCLMLVVPLCEAIEIVRKGGVK